MNPLLVPSYAPPSRAADTPGHRGQTADGGFKDMLDGPPAGRGRKNDVSDAARHQRSEAAQDGDRKTAEGAKRVARDRDAENEEDADRGEGALPWFDMRTTAAATASKDRMSDGSARSASDTNEQNDEHADLRRDRYGTAAEGRVAAKAGREATSAQPGGEATTAIEGQAAQPSTHRPGTAEIAAILDGAGDASRSMETSANGKGRELPNSAQSTDPDLDRDGDVRLLSDPGMNRSNSTSALQQMPFGSAVAMLNLMAQGSSATEMKSGAAPINSDSTAKGKARPSLDTGSPSSLLEALPTDASETATRKGSRVAAGAPATESNMDRDAREEPGSDQDSRQSTAVDKPLAKGFDAPFAARLGTTAAGVVETLASTPSLKAAQAVSDPGADPTTVSAGTHSLKIQLRPVELGDITATLRMNGDTISVEMATEKVEAYERLSVDSDAIVKALRGLGLQVDQITIQPPQAAAPSSRSDGGMQNQTSDGSSQQFAQTGNSSGGGSEGQRGTASQGEQRNAGQARQVASPANENRVARGLVI